MAMPNKTVWNARNKRPVKAFGSKTYLTDVASDNGWTVVKADAENVGEWNESVCYYAVSKDDVSVLLMKVMKGSRAKWSEATEEYYNKCMGMSYAEVENMKHNS